MSRMFKNIFNIKREGEIRRICTNCCRQHSDECPNSSMYYSLNDKPHFKYKNDKT